MKKEIKNIDIKPLLTEDDYVYKYIDLLIQDKTTGETIIFAEDEYENYQPTDHYTEEIIKKLIAENKLNYRVHKSSIQQKDRTKKKAEVFTPSWICKQMIDMCEPPTDWKELVVSTWLEITCGEAPYITSRYDTTTGEFILIPDRIGILDRKLMAVNNNVSDYDEWIKWSMRSLKCVYGYEWQGDNLFIARVNVLRCMVENYRYRWGKMPEDELIERWIEVICWNFWQMDGLKDVIPLTDIPAKIRDWKAPNDEQIIEFRSLKPEKEEKPKKGRKKKNEV